MGRASTTETEDKGWRARATARPLFRLLVCTVVGVGVLFTFVNPTRQWLDQRTTIAAAHERVEVLDDKSRDLAERAERLRTEAEVERLAREQYGLVKPGEEAYAILPSPVTTPPPAPAPVEVEKTGWAKVKDKLTFWR